MTTTTWGNYDRDSETFFQTYEGLNFSKIHRAFLPYLPTKGARCLDIGSGSGRDAFAMAKRGYKITAVEPSSAMLHLAKIKHHHPNISWIEDSLPELRHVVARNEKYKFILLSAVWMHIHPAERDCALKTLASLVATDGFIALTIRIGPASPERMMHHITIDDFIEQARSQGLEQEYVGRKTNDVMKREDITWRKIILKPKI